jgi:hypothetical protein
VAIPPPPAAVVLYRTAAATPLLITIASASTGSGVLHAHGPALHGEAGAEAAATIEAVATSLGTTSLVWDGDAPVDLTGIRALVRETAASLLVVEWQPTDADLVALLVAEPPCDVLVVRPGDIGAIQRLTVGHDAGTDEVMVALLAQRWGAALGVPVHPVPTDDALRTAAAADGFAAVGAGDGGLAPGGRNRRALAEVEPHATLVLGRRFAPERI